MALQILKLHWKAARWPLFPFLLAAFGLPLTTALAARGWQNVDATGYNAPWRVLEVASSIALVYPFLAFAVGSAVALTAWNWDHQKGHVYTLSLPIERWRYASTKFAAGLIIAALPALLMLAGGLAVHLVALPAGLTAYPSQLALQFFLAVATAYGILFALAAGTIRTAVVTLSSVGAVLFFGDAAFDFVGILVPSAADVSPARAILSVAFGDGGPLRIFLSNWMLIDV